MNPPIFPQFLADPSEYRKAEKHWSDEWNSIPRVDREQLGWRTPWLLPQADGNPIFSAFSPILKKGIRIIQFEPTQIDVDFGWYFDTFGGDMTDPLSIRELVVGCALSLETSKMAFDLISTWLVGDVVVSAATSRVGRPTRIASLTNIVRSPSYYADSLVAEAA